VCVVGGGGVLVGLLGCVFVGFVVFLFFFLWEHIDLTL